MRNSYYHEQLNRNFSIATVWIKGGSNKDIIGKKGINQILCSLITRGCEGFDNFDLSNYIESFGAELNHEVLEDGMSISIKSLNEDFDKLLPLLDLMVNKPKLSDIQFQIVKKSTLRAIKRDKENPFNKCFDNWRKVVYSKHPYAFNSIGYEDDVSSISYQDILNEYENFRNRNKYLISNNLKIKTKNLNFLDDKISEKDSYLQNRSLSKEKRVICSTHDTNQIIILLGNQTCSRRSNDYLPLKVLESHLSYGMSSLLFKLFREKNGITYDVGVFNSVKEGNSPFLVYLSVSNKNALFAFEILILLWRELLFKSISEEEIRLAKEKLKSSFLISNQSLDEILQRKILLISYGIDPNSEKNDLSNIDAFTSENIKILMNKYFAKPFLSITGDKKICSDIKQKWIEDF